MIGYTPAEQAIRAAHGDPPGTGADDPPAWHDHPFEGASDTGLPDGAVYGPAPASPDTAVAVTPEWWRP